ncbi:MAG: two-component system response regulator, partial [Candidatus Marinimicrobia bacterium CG08_land_8_20_14_0_20_45_22]
MMNLNIVIIDDDKAQRDILSGYLKKIGCHVFSCESGNNCIPILENQSLDAVITDYRMPGMNGMEILQRVKEINPEIQVIILTAFGTIQDAVSAMKSGAWDYLTKPVDLDELDIKLQKIAGHNTLVRENQLLRSQIADSSLSTELIYKSQSIADVLNVVARIGDSKASVLIQGESGTGKEMIARTIHRVSSRRDKPFVAVNCAAIPETLFESELFGHEKGAFTGAYERTKGRIEIAENGTLFLDEVADIPLNFQVKLLRVIQEKEFHRLGSSQTLKADVRLVSATNKDIQKMVDSGSFRADLFFRLNVIPITIPPLRERREDIPPLVTHFIQKHASLNRRPITGISAEGLNSLMRYDYPGNVRELENIIERAVILARSTVITTDDLPLKSPDENNVTLNDSMTNQVEQLEKRLIAKTLDLTHNVVLQAAKLLGVS